MNFSSQPEVVTGKRRAHRGGESSLNYILGGVEQPDPALAPRASYLEERAPLVPHDLNSFQAQVRLPSLPPCRSRSRLPAAAASRGLTRPAQKDKDIKAIKGMMIKDLRIHCRANNISPAGPKDELVERLLTAIEAGMDLNLLGGSSVAVVAGSGAGGNNYSRPVSQNVDNFLTDKPSR